MTCWLEPLGFVAQ